MNKKERIGIIGAGIAGIATSIRLASLGYEVEVFEANNYPGGKLSSFSDQGFRFDAGPSLFTMPGYVEELFEFAQQDIAPHFSYQRLPVVCHYFWEDGTRLSAHADGKDFANEVEKKLGVKASVIEDTLKESERKYEVTGKIFLYKSLHQLKTWMSWEVIKAMIKIPTLNLFSSMNSVNEKQLKHPKLVQLFNRFATYNGSNPYKVPGLLNIIPHFEHKIGAFFPKGGMHSITMSLFELAKRKGVQFHLGKKVDRIELTGKKVKGLQVDQRLIPFDRVVSNMDIFYTYKKLLPNQKHPESTLNQPKSTSALIFYWGIDKQFSELGLHNILFSDDYKHEFDCLEKGSISDDPTIYINITQKYEKGDAPDGCENWFTMINVPHQSGQDWDQLIAKSRKNILKKISRILGHAIAPHIVCEHLLDPRTIESKTSSHLGALYGTSSNKRMAAFLRHANFSRTIKNLYFCGGSVHPGGGIPLCLLSARIVAELIEEQQAASQVYS